MGGKEPDFSIYDLFSDTDLLHNFASLIVRTCGTGAISSHLDLEALGITSVSSHLPRQIFRLLLSKQFSNYFCQKQEEKQAKKTRYDTSPAFNRNFYLLNYLNEQYCWYQFQVPNDQTGFWRGSLME